MLLDTFHDYVMLQVGHKKARLEVNSKGQVRAYVREKRVFLAGVQLPKRALRRLRKKLGRQVVATWPGLGGQG